MRKCHTITGTLEYLLQVNLAVLIVCKWLHTAKLTTLAQLHQIVPHMIKDHPKMTGHKDKTCATSAHP